VFTIAKKGGYVYYFRNELKQLLDKYNTGTTSKISLIATFPESSPPQPSTSTKWLAADRSFKFLMHGKVIAYNIQICGKWNGKSIKYCELPEQKNPWSSSQRPPRSFPSGIDFSNLTPIFEDPLFSKARRTLPREP